ncbi:hypothetical protein BJ684DRAFT_14465 [Piptocephalis cylindrospora]|uniref:PH domain-containing protein n=1 Tax=Piptocephalis cylindrospora TaxID=1907219 RepID=A0A4P9Y832_9FUNG|nr:hypothetical protein BJ684DRAFT_14465 [Piptocephalis cylindrospora]|eukprot:RKP15268.1 hypothetical protein BJ684DRAFT_14465 [Piptocephalis cylindrospora]
MACDLTDPAIAKTYQEIISGSPTNWLLLGYNDTRDKISLYTSGEDGLEGLRDALTDEVLYGFVRLDGLDPPQNILVTYVSEQVSGSAPRRAPTPPSTSGNEEGEGPASAVPKAMTQQVEMSEDTVLTPPPEAERPVPTGPSPEEIEEERRREQQAREEAETLRKRKERQAKAEEEDRKRKEALKQRMLQAQKDARDGGAVQGYLTVQGQKNYLWQRRWYSLKDKSLSLYRSDVDLEPRTTLPLSKGALVNVTDADKEVLIPNSFKVELANDQAPWYFFADDLEAVKSDEEYGGK